MATIIIQALKHGGVKDPLEGIMLSSGLKLFQNNGDPASVGRIYRTSAVPPEISDKQLGEWYLAGEEGLRPLPYGQAVPESYRHMSDGGSCWPTWTIYNSPEDFPGKVVARLFIQGGGTPLVILGETLEEVRQALPQSLRHRPNNFPDERFTPSMVESWL